MNSIKIRIPDSDHHVLIVQNGLRVNQESLYLLRTINMMKRHFSSAGDLGCGSGLMSVGLAALFPAVHVTGYEIQEELAETARANVDLNGYQQRVDILCADIRASDKRLPDSSHDLVVMNPPFRRANTGRMSDDMSIRVSNHEHYGDLDAFIRVGSILLKHKGVLGIVMLPDRLSELLISLEKNHVPAFRMQMIHHHHDSDANASIVLGRKGGKSVLAIMPPVYLV